MSRLSAAASVLLGGMCWVGCSDSPKTGRASLEMTPFVDASPPPHCQVVGVECVKPIEVSIKLVSVYLGRENVGKTAAVYGNPGCELVVTNGLTNPNLGSCGIDVGMMSSSGVKITTAPIYIDLAQSPADLHTALRAGRFAVPVGTFSTLRLEAGTDAPEGAPEGTQDTLPTGTTMNVRFFAAGMTAPYEVRNLIVQDVVFPSPFAVEDGQEIVIDLHYGLTGVVYSMLPSAAGSPGLHPNAKCTPAQGDPAKHYCFDSSHLSLRPMVVVDGMATTAKWDAPASLWDSPETMWAP